MGRRISVTTQYHGVLMPSGIQVINNAGTILIDENYSNLAVRASGTVTGSTSSTGRLDFAVASGLNAPMFAIAPSAAQFSVLAYRPDTNVIKIQGRDNTQSTNFPYFIFDTPVASGLNYGLQVFNASGVLTFDSNLKYARVVDVFGGTTEASWAGTRTYASGRTYAVVELGRAFTKTTENLGGGNYEYIGRRSSLKVVSNVVTTSFVQTYVKSGTVNSPPITNNAAKFAVIDVTGY